MKEPFKSMNLQILEMLGVDITVIDLVGSTVPAKGIFTTELAETGQLNSVMQQITTITIDCTIDVKRDYRIESNGKQWAVDRKLKDDGYLAYWNLYEYIP